MFEVLRGDFVSDLHGVVAVAVGVEWGRKFIGPWWV